MFEINSLVIHLWVQRTQASVLTRRPYVDNRVVLGRHIHTPEYGHRPYRAHVGAHKLLASPYCPSTPWPVNNQINPYLNSIISNASVVIYPFTATPENIKSFILCKQYLKNNRVIFSVIGVHISQSITPRP